jgi:hypothetical protein
VLWPEASTCRLLFRAFSRHRLLPSELTMPPFTEDRWAPELGIVFSSRDGFVWASWPDSDGAVRLGRHDMVANMMRDFLAQDDLGERLHGRDST